MKIVRERKGRFWAIIPLLISAGLLTLIVTRFDDWSLLSRVHVPTLLLAIGVSLGLNCGLGGVKWWWVMRNLGMHLQLRRVMGIWLGLFPMAFFAPFMTGHLLHAVALEKVERVGAFAAAEVVVADKGLSLVSTFGLIAVGQVLLPAGHPLRHLWILVGSVLVVVAFFFERPLVQALGRFQWFKERSRILQYPISLRRKIVLLLVGMVYQCSDGLSMALACIALGAPMDPVVAMAGFPVILLLTYIPITFSGFGLREGLTAGFFTQSLSWDQGIAAGLLIDLFEYIAPALFGLMALPWLLKRMTAPAKEP